MVFKPTKCSGPLTITSLEEAYQCGCYGYLEPVVMRTSPRTRKAIISLLGLEEQDAGVFTFHAAVIEGSLLMPDNVVEYWWPPDKADPGEFKGQPIAILTLLAQESKHASATKPSGL